MIVLAILAAGFVSLQNLTLDLFPDIDLPIAVVSVSYEEAAPEDVERQISEPLEQALGTIEGIEGIQTQSSTGSSLVIMTFALGTNLDNALLEVRERVDQISGILPEEAGNPNVLRFNPNQLPIMAVSLSGDSLAQLQRVAEDQVVPVFERQSGVANVTTEGGQSRIINIVLDESRLLQYGASRDNVLQALGTANQAASVGVVERGDAELAVRVDGTFTSIADIENTLVNTDAGTQLVVSDVAEVVDTYTTPNTTLINGQEAIVMSVMRQSGSNAVQVSDNVLASIDDLDGELSETVQLDVVYDTSEFVRMTIDSVVWNILLGGIFAVIILLLFLKSIRATIVIGVSIPIAIIATFSLIYFTGETLNILTMGGLALGIGMMVDSSIIILENIVSYRQRGYSKLEAAKEGATELAPAVIASTMTTLVVFLPMVFVTGIAAELFVPLAMTVAFALLAALVVSITLVPMLSSKLLVDINEDSTKRRYWFDRFLNRLTNGYQHVLEKALRFKKTTLFIIVALLGLSLLLIPSIGSEFIPSGDQGQINIEVETPSGSRQEITEDIAMQVNDILSDYEDIIRVNQLTIGSGDMMSSMMGMGGGSNIATFTLELVPSTERDRSTNDLVQEISENTTHIAGADITVSAADDMQMGAPVSVELQGPEHAVLNQLSEEVVQEIEAITGVYNATTSVDAVQPQLAIKVDHLRASQYGLVEALIMNQIQTRLSDQLIMRYREDGESIDVRVMYPEDQVQTISDLENLMLDSPLGTRVPLKEVAAFEYTDAPASLQRGNQQPLVSISMDVIGADIGTVSSDIETVLSGFDFPEEYRYSIGGQVEDMEEAFADLALVLMLSIFLVYVVMAVQFESFIMPFIIMFSLPVSVVGVLFGYFVTGTPLSIVGFIGIIMLAGIVVNNAIVLVDYINILRRRDYSRTEAIIEAGRSRLRPILMTTLTTVLAMIPLGLGLGEGAEMQQPMAVTVIFGLSISSVFILILIPVIYAYVDQVSSWYKNKKQAVN